MKNSIMKAIVIVALLSLLVACGSQVPKPAEHVTAPAAPPAKTETAPQPVKTETTPVSVPEKNESMMAANETAPQNASMMENKSMTSNENNPTVYVKPMRNNTNRMIFNSSMSESTQESANASTGEVYDIVMQGFAFSPAAVTIHVGDQVRFTNHDSAPHSATAATFDTGELKPGDSKTFTFNNAGTYTFGCMFHSSMKGTITVE